MRGKNHSIHPFIEKNVSIHLQGEKLYYRYPFIGYLKLFIRNNATTFEVLHL